ncbi:Protein phosphatase 2C family protein [Quillaja saponaria]|uniref:Protein phosphatase n=1 Tax=Quillaja saponaria TaxID=32244 RepID=A0AAD7QHY1_QUISA|nr:Protein phosphatase 2C family protein [Quillaja saponaria]
MFAFNITTMLRNHCGTTFQGGSQSKLKMVAASCYIPKDNIERPLGDDAHFICSEEQIIGVADGVGSWHKKGVDGGEYAREFMKNSEIAVKYQAEGAICPKEVLKQAYLNTKAKGSSTACILMLKEQGILKAVIVGDSGFLVFRENSVLIRSPVQQKSFNCPYQLGNSSGCDHPESAMEMEIGVSPGDVVVVGTDGLFDNLYENEIVAVLKEKTKESVQPEELAWTLTEMAYYISVDHGSFSPFAREAAGHHHVGGKTDDITVIVAHIVSSS